MYLVAKPLNRSEARVDFIAIQALLLFVCKSLCYHANYFLVSIISRSPLTSVSYKGLVTYFHRTVKWSVVLFIASWPKSGNQCVKSGAYPYRFPPFAEIGQISVPNKYSPRGRRTKGREGGS